MDSVNEYKALELLHLKSEDALSRGNTGMSLGAPPESELTSREVKDGEKRGGKKRRKSSTVATERVRACYERAKK
eukprot:597772-Pelagomonas_calceolata.AAC.1